MRLIDADKLTKQIAGMAFANNYPANKALALCKLIDSQPTAYDVDNVLEQLEKLKNEKEIGSHKVMVKEAIEIIKAGGKDE